MTDIVFLDTETTGVHPEREVWEIAMVKRSPGKGERETVIQVNPVDLSKADPFALKINGFYDRYFSLDNVNVPPGTQILTPASAAAVVENWTRGAHVVGAVPNFDTESLDKLLRQQAKLLPGWHYHLIDVETLAVGYLQAMNQLGVSYKNSDLGYSSSWNYVDMPLPWKSDELSKAIGVEPPTDEERHTAMGDVRWAIRTYDKVMGIS
jgi:hypothetical protein